MNKLGVTTIIAIAFTLSIGSQVHASAQGRPAPAVYVALGDGLSNGHGTDHPLKESYPALLARHLPRGSHFQNLALDRATVSQALDFELTDALKARPTIATIFLVYGDIAERTPLATYGSQLGQLFVALSRRHAHIFVGNMFDPRVQVDKSIYNPDPDAKVARSYNAVIDSVAAKYGVTVVDIFSSTGSIWGKRQNVSSDGLVLTAKGNAALARLFYQVMHERGVL